MLEQIQDLPEGVIGFEAIGRLSAEDYEKTLIPVANAMLAQGKKLRFLYYAGPRFEGFDIGAAWDDMTWGMRHMTDFDKVAFVSDHTVLTSAMKPLVMLMPTKFQVFAVKDLDAAKKWLAG